MRADLQRFLLLSMAALVVACAPAESDPPPDAGDELPNPCECGERVCGTLCGLSCGTCDGDAVCSDDGLACLPPLPIGAACEADRDCGLNRRCVAEPAGGYCTKDCSSLDPCPDGAACVVTPDGAGQCFQTCDPQASTSQCRADEGYRCTTDGYCPACIANCDGRTCGDDGCGGVCGVAPPGEPDCLFPDELCDAGACKTAYMMRGDLRRGSSQCLDENPCGRWDAQAFARPNGMIVLVGGRETVWLAESGTLPVVRASRRVELVLPSKLANMSEIPTTPLPSLPAGLARPHAAMLHDRLYVAGGIEAAENEPDRPSTRFLMLPVGSVDAEWQDAAPPQQPMPEPSMGGALVALGNALYLVPGETQDGPSRGFHRFDPETGRWSEAPSRPSARSYVSAVVAGGRLFLIGGWDGTRAVDTVEIFDPQSGWRTSTPLKRAMAGSPVVAAQGRLFVMGGHDGPGAGLEIPYVQSIDIETGRTQMVGVTRSSRVGQIPVAMPDGLVLVMGGWIFDPTGLRTVTEVATFGVPRP